MIRRVSSASPSERRRRVRQARDAPDAAGMRRVRRGIVRLSGSGLGVARGKRRLDVALEDAAVRPAAGQRRGVDPGFRHQPAGDRRGEDAARRRSSAGPRGAGRQPELGAVCDVRAVQTRRTAAAGSARRRLASGAISPISSLTGDVLRARRHDDASQNAVDAGFHVHRRLVGLDLGQEIARARPCRPPPSPTGSGFPSPSSATVPA